VGSSGVIVHFDGKRWRTSTAGGGLVLTSIWASGSEVFAAGWDGTILQRRPPTP